MALIVTVTASPASNFTTLFSAPDAENRTCNLRNPAAPNSNIWSFRSGRLPAKSLPTSPPTRQGREGVCDSAIALFHPVPGWAGKVQEGALRPPDGRVLAQNPKARPPLHRGGRSAMLTAWLSTTSTCAASGAPLTLKERRGRMLATWPGGPERAYLDILKNFCRTDQAPGALRYMATFSAVNL